MPSYTLHYFATRGFAEVSRQLFHLSDTPFTDHRIEYADYDKLKNDMPFGQMPVLDMDDKKIPQSSAIVRYLATKFGYAGKTPFESAWVDALADQYKDYVTEIRPAFGILSGRLQGDKEKTLKDLVYPARDKLFGILEKQLGDTTSGFLVGDSLTWIDLVIADHVTTMEGLIPGFLANFPKVQSHQTKVQQIPKLKEWLDKRPVTQF